MATRNDDLFRAVWRKSTYSSQDGNCVEICDLPGSIGIRDSKTPDGSVLRSARHDWAAFILEVKAGQLDLS
jgi:Domain of unknown function (DUF397)